MNKLKSILRAVDEFQQQRRAWLAFPVGGYFVSHQLANTSDTYGTFAVVLGLLAFLYLEAELTLYAVEINVVREYRLWPRSIAPPPYTEQDQRAFQLYAQVEKRGGERTSS